MEIVCNGTGININIKQMYTFKFTLYDILSYFLPGAIVLLCFIVLLSPSITSLIDIINILNDIGFTIGVAVVLISYIIGNVIAKFGAFLYYKIGIKLWGSPYPKKESGTLSINKQRALVRHYSKENYSSIRTWKVLKNMSQNISFSFLTMIAIVLNKFIVYKTSDWAFLIIVALISSIVFLNRAHTFDKWYYMQLRDTVDVLQLENRVIKDINNTRLNSTHN